MSSKTVSLTLQVSQVDLPALMALAAKSGVSINTVASKSAKKEKKEKDPDAPKKEPNDWINFCSRGRKALEAGGLKPGFAVQQYCSSLKETLPMLTVTDANGKEKQVPNYASISDEEILARFKSWTAPEQSNAAAKRASPSAAERASPSAAAAAGAPAEKPKKQWSEAAKASAAEKRALTKAAKVAGAAPASAWASPNKDEPKAVAAKPADAKPAAVEEADFTEFTPIKIGGKDYLVNCRGDLMDADYEWVGHYDAKSKKINKAAKKPADLEED
jgi:hypothetical protein